MMGVGGRLGVGEFWGGGGYVGSRLRGNDGWRGRGNDGMGMRE